MRVPSRLCLSAVAGPCKGWEYDSAALGKFHLTVGRVKKAQIYLKDAAISEKHAEIAWDGVAAAWILRDIGSSNGTALNSREIKPYRAHHLSSGDRIDFGAHTVVQVQVEEQGDDDISLECYLKAFFEARCQALENECVQAADDLLQRLNKLKELAPAQR